MFNRKVLFIALLAVVLLVSSLMDGAASAGRVIKHRRRAAEPAAGGIAEIANFQRATLTNLVNQITGAAAADPNDQQLAFRDRRKPRNPRVSLDASGLNTPQAVLTTDHLRKPHRSRRL